MARATAMRVVGNKEGNGDSCKSDGDGNKGGRQVTAPEMKRVMVMVTRVAGEQWQRQ